jgi:hypothetical protein
LQIAGTGTTTFSDAISLSGDLDFNGTNLVINGVPNTIGGDLLVTNSGVFSTGNNAVLAISGALIQDGTGSNTIGADITADQGITIATDITLDGDPDEVITFSTDGNPDSDITIGGDITNTDAESLVLALAYHITIDGDINLDQLKIEANADIVLNGDITLDQLEAEAGLDPTTSGEILQRELPLPAARLTVTTRADLLAVGDITMRGDNTLPRTTTARSTQGVVSIRGIPAPPAPPAPPAAPVVIQPTPPAVVPPVAPAPAPAPAPVPPAAPDVPVVIQPTPPAVVPPVAPAPAPSKPEPAIKSIFNVAELISPAVVQAVVMTPTAVMPAVTTSGLPSVPTPSTTPSPAPTSGGGSETTTPQPAAQADGVATQPASTAINEGPLQPSFQVENQVAERYSMGGASLLLDPGNEVCTAAQGCGSVTSPSGSPIPVAPTQLQESPQSSPIAAPADRPGDVQPEGQLQQPQQEGAVQQQVGDPVRGEGTGAQSSDGESTDRQSSQEPISEESRTDDQQVQEEEQAQDESNETNRAEQPAGGTGLRYGLRMAFRSFSRPWRNPAP